MKNSKIFIAIAATILITSCSKLIGDLTTFEIPISNSVTIPASLPIDTLFEMETPTFTDEIKSTIESNQSALNLIKSVKLKSLKIHASNELQDFDFMEYVELYLVADGIDPVPLINHTPLPNAQLKELDYEVGDENLKDYLTKEGVRLMLKAKTDQAVKASGDVKFDVVFEINANPLQ